VTKRPPGPPGWKPIVPIDIPPSLPSKKPTEKLAKERTIITPAPVLGYLIKTNTITMKSKPKPVKSRKERTRIISGRKHKESEKRFLDCLLNSINL